MEFQTLDDQPKAKTMTATINVLTILTFVWCGVALLLSGWQYYTTSKFNEQLPLFQEQLDKMEDVQNELAYNLMLQSIDNAKRKFNYNGLLLAINILGAGLCAFGAFLMRKMNSNGYYLWLVGEIAPILVTVAIVGFNLVGGIEFGIGMLVASVFIILYGLQLKHMH